jgi:hypothetical protein
LRKAFLNLKLGALQGRHNPAIRCRKIKMAIGTALLIAWGKAVVFI